MNHTERQLTPKLPSYYIKRSINRTEAVVKKLNIDIVKSKLKGINPNIEILSEEYVSAKESLKVKCLLDNNVWFMTWDSLHSGKGCPECYYRSKFVKLDEMKERLRSINPNIIILNEEYDLKTKVLRCKCLKDGYEWDTTWKSLRDRRGCSACAGIVKKTLSGIIKELSESNPNIEILSTKYESNGKKLKFRCKIDGHLWSTTWNSIISSGRGCPKCANQVLHDGNRLSIIRPELVRYFYDKKEADNVFHSSGKKVELICPDCGLKKTKKITIANLANQGFSCDYCSDGISTPEKFAIYFFKEMGLPVERQYSPDWAGKFKYDFFIKDKIIETHGMQHYKNVNMWRRFEDEKENDKKKYKMAIENGIKKENYITVDCRFSDFYFLKSSFEKAFSCLYDLSDIDWQKIWYECQRSFVPKIWEAWNNKKEDDTTLSIGRELGINRYTVMKYIKAGTILGKCFYDPKSEMIKSARKNKNKNSQRVFQYSLSGDYIRTFESISQAVAFSKSHYLAIISCCKGKRDSVGGFKWSLEELQCP